MELPANVATMNISRYIQMLRCSLAISMPKSNQSYTFEFTHNKPYIDIYKHVCID